MDDSQPRELRGQRNQPHLLAPSQRPQQDGVDHAEDGGGGADAQRQRQDRRGGEAGRAEKTSNGEAQVPEHGFHGHSARNAMAGSTRVARRAGSQLATTATETSSAATQP